MNNDFSGGGTINAILFAAQWISNQKGLETIDVNALEGHTLLIIHSGGDSQRCPTLSVCGKVLTIKLIILFNRHGHFFQVYQKLILLYQMLIY